MSLTELRTRKEEKRREDAIARQMVHAAAKGDSEGLAGCLQRARLWAPSPVLSIADLKVDGRTPLFFCGQGGVI